MVVTRMLFLGFGGLNKNEVFECIFEESVELFPANENDSIRFITNDLPESIHYTLRIEMFKF